MLAGSNRRPVQLGKGGGKLAQAAGQAMALEDLGAHGEKHRLDALRGGLRRGGAQRLLDRQRGLDQGRQLAGHQCQVARGQSAGERQAPALPALLAGTGGLHIERRQLALAQQLADLARAVRLQHALLLATAGVEGEVFEGGHYSSRVTRRTSSTVVTPSSTLRRPSSRMLGPLVRACRVISCSEDSLWISERMWSSNTTSS